MSESVQTPKSDPEADTESARTSGGAKSTGAVASPRRKAAARATAVGVGSAARGEAALDPTRADAFSASARVWPD